jgi:hypothetical protein
MVKDKQFTLFWKTGERQIVNGRNVAEAMTLAGYSAGALGALDFHAEGDCDRYAWDAGKHSWEITPAHPDYAAFQLARVQMEAHNQHHE